ncbi:molybdopterin-dependent oxidoreductase [Geovibrio ferrireducens]|uniref:molybdopterin-dependent oxidoreductase n=1 Tax=Geovibrio ferrireducens TaxID=46201 RepID=UPI0022463E60|nr:molybdopterin-dependent oxidoreductase [Geovibrio ferrireducens]
MSLKDKLTEQKLTRRSMLKAMSATVAAAALQGCGGSGNGGEPYQVVSPSDNLVYDKDIKIFHTTGAYNCGSRCQHYAHVKNGKVVKMTSAGDKKRNSVADAEAEYDSSEFGKQMELRACVRCYGGYQGILYQPDRLKYPLMRIDPSKPKGDINNFKRVSWDEALDAVAEKLKAAYDRAAQDNLSYVPIMTRYWFWLMMSYYMGQQPCVRANGNESTGGADLGSFDTVGSTVYVNSRTDRYNTKFMITWAMDVTRGTYWNVHTHFMNTKMKEKVHGDIPMVVISSTYSDAAAMLSTGIQGYQYTVDGHSKVVDIPGWIACRPTTDAALAIGVMYVIYKNGRMDTDFMQQTAPTTAAQADRKCFGFWKEDTVKSQAPSTGVSRSGYQMIAYADIPADAPYNASGTAIPKGTPLNGYDFKVPVGESFEEYLLSREVEWGGAVSSLPASLKYRVPDTSAAPGDGTYSKVLDYIGALTGVNPDVIEALAMKYSEFAGHPTDAAFIETGGGAQRAWNADEWVWSLVGLSAMCGYVNKKGGGTAGLSMSRFSESLAFNTNGSTDAPISGSNAAEPTSSFGIDIELSGWQNTILTGKDHRKRANLIEDVKYQTSGRVDLSSAGDKLIDVDVIIHTNINNINTHPNTNKNILAARKVPTQIVMDQVMTPTALLADIILPAATHFESDTFAIPAYTSITHFFHREKVIDVMYDTLPEHELQQRLGAKLTEKGLTGAPYVFAPFDTFTEDAYNNVKITDYYKQKVSSDTALPSADEMREIGTFTLEVPKDTPLVPMMGDLIPSGTLDTSTGFLNFYSLFRAMRPAEKVTDPYLSGDIDPANPVPAVYYPGGWRNATLCYQPNLHGRETYFDNRNPLTGKFTGFVSPLSGRAYKMTYMTNKSRNRGHTVFDSVAAIKDMFPQMAKLNPITAAERGITEGAMVYVYNDRGCMKIPAHLTHEILPGIVSIEHGAWYRAHPTERVKVWMQDGSDPANLEAFHERSVPVDVGGADNILTNDFFGEDTMMCTGAVPAQSGPCEVSLVKPENGGTEI